MDDAMTLHAGDGGNRGALRDLLPQVLPQVIPCPSSMALDALQAIAVDFCTAAEVWAERLDDALPRGEQLLRANAPRGAAIVRIRGLWMEGGRVDARDYASDGALVRLHTPPQRDVAVTLEAVLRPARHTERVPSALLEEWGDALVWGALARLKAMNGRHVEWSDAQGAALNNQLYNEATVRARARTLRRRYGDGRGALRLWGGFAAVTD